MSFAAIAKWFGTPNPAATKISGALLTALCLIGAPGGRAIAHGGSPGFNLNSFTISRPQLIVPMHHLRVPSPPQRAPAEPSRHYGASDVGIAAIHREDDVVSCGK
jgi:hypothetical protein